MGRRQPQPRAGGLDIEAHDARLAQLAQSGDADAFSRLAERHYRAIYRLAAGLLGSGPEAMVCARGLHCDRLGSRLQAWHIRGTGDKSGRRHAAGYRAAAQVRPAFSMLPNCAYPCTVKGSIV